MEGEKLNQVGKSTKLWEVCWDPRVCAHIPLDGEKCLTAHICVRIVEETSQFFVEAEVSGHTSRYALGNGCIDTLSVGIAHIDICISDLFHGIHAVTLQLSVKACLGGNIGPIPLEHCWDLFKDRITIHVIGEEDLYSILGVNSRSDNARKFYSVQSAELLESCV